MSTNSTIKSLSKLKLNHYIKIGESYDNALQLYAHNIKIAGSLNTLITILEITIRNKLDKILKITYGKDWAQSELKGFMINKNLTYKNKFFKKIHKNHFLKNKVDASKRRIKYNHLILTHDKLISQLPFSFWVSLFQVHHYKILKGCPIKIFYKLPPGWNRKKIHTMLDFIRRINNKINHNNPIIIEGNFINLFNANKAHNYIYELLTLLNPDIITFLKSLDEYEVEIYNLHQNFLKENFFKNPSPRTPVHYNARA